MFAKTSFLNYTSVLLSSLVLMTATAKAADWHVSGYAKTYGVAQAKPDIDGVETKEVFQSQNALRLMLAGTFESNLSLELHYEVKPIFSSKSRFGGFIDLLDTTSSGSTSYRVVDLNNERRYDQGETTLLQNLDRLNVRYDFGSSDLTIGRQAISFGSARFVSPTDIFEPFLVSTLDTEYRVGIDALRYQGSMGDFTEYDMGLVVGKDAKTENSAVYGRFKTSVAGNDIEATAVLRDQLIMVGGGLERAIGDMGFWAEAAYVFADDDADYIRASIGLDRAFGEDILGLIEYHYSEVGVSDLGEFFTQFNSAAFDSGGVYLIGEHYLIPAVNWTATPLLNVSGSAFVNLSDGSAFLRLGGEYSLSDNLYTDFGIYAGVGEGANVPVSGPGPFLGEFGSEFGSFPATAYISLRYYF